MFAIFDGGERLVTGFWGLGSRFLFRFSLNAPSCSGPTTTTTTVSTMPTSLSPRREAAILPSLPPSPSLLEEVFSHPHPWSVRFEEFDLQSPRRSSPASGASRTKGKGKRMPENEDEDEDEDAQHRMSSPEAYPPMTDEAAETRRVEEVRAHPLLHSPVPFATVSAFLFASALPPQSFLQHADDPNWTDPQALGACRTTAPEITSRGRTIHPRPFSLLHRHPHCRPCSFRSQFHQCLRGTRQHPRIQIARNRRRRAGGVHLPPR